MIELRCSLEENCGDCALVSLESRLPSVAQHLRLMVGQWGLQKVVDAEQSTRRHYDAHNYAIMVAIAGRELLEQHEDGIDSERRAIARIAECHIS